MKKLEDMPVKSLLILVLFMLKQLIVVGATNEECNEILSKKSYDFNINSTTSRSPPQSYGPSQAILYNTHAWCAAVANADQYLQIDLGLVMMVKSIAIQGNPDDDEFVKSFSLSYSVIEGHWLTYLETGAKRIFEGNSNKEKVASQTLNNITAARYVRIIPETWHNHVCIRAELYGCDADPLGPLGMMNGDIPDSAITASSAATDHPPPDGRLYWTKKAGYQSWAANIPAQSNEWLQIDLSQKNFVTAIATQGRHVGSPYSNQWVTSYSLSHSNGHSLWTEYKENGVKKVFTGNTDCDTMVRHILTSVFYARFVRFLPITWYNHISMRVEVYSFRRASPDALGMESQEIPNSQITASSHYDSNFPPKAGRLNFQLLQACWTPKVLGADQWLKIDFGHTMLVTGIVTQGKGNNAARWVTSYQIVYSLDNTNWVFYKDTGSSQVKTFQANTDDIGYVTRIFDRDITARYIRIHPKTYNPTNELLGLRAEVLGRRKGPLGAPVFKNQGSSPHIFAHKNQDVTLQCEAVGALPITITWSYKGNIIQTRTSNTNLYIQAVTPGQEGFYICTATNALGSSNKTLHLKLKNNLDICTQYKSLFDDSRVKSMVTSTPLSDNFNINDNDWYLFSGTKTNYRMANKCVPENHCGAAAPGYMEGDLPAVSDGVVKRKVCFHSSSNCCHFSVYIYVCNCYSFYIYQLKKLDLSWNARYCVEKNINENSDRIFQLQESPQHLVLHHHISHQLFSVADQLSCMMCCLADPKCKSFNFNAKLTMCELNNATALEYPQHMKPRPGFLYFFEVKIQV